LAFAGRVPQASREAAKARRMPLVKPHKAPPVPRKNTVCAKLTFL